MTRSPGIAGLNFKLQDAAPRARVTLAGLVELLGRDALLRTELYAAVERSSSFMFWPRMIERPVLVPQDAPRRASALSEPAPRPSAPPAPKRAPQSTAGAAPMPQATVPAAQAPMPPMPPARRGALPRRSVAPAVAAASVRAADELEAELQEALRQRGAR